MATGGAAGPIIAGAAIGAGSSAVISGVVTAKHGGSIADVAKAASDGFMWGAIGGSVGGVTSINAAPAITKAFGTGLKSTLVTGGLTGAVGGGLTGGVMSGLSGNDAKTVLKDTLKSAIEGAVIGIAYAGIGYGINSLRSGGTTKATGSGGEAGKSGTETSRPTWRQSELDAVKDFPDYDAQKSFINGEEVPYGTKRSVRPDYYKDGYSVDIKNYNVESASGRSNLARNIVKQYYQRIENLPEGTKQSVMIDIRGQNVTDADLRALYDNIMKQTDNGVEILFKMD